MGRGCSSVLLCRPGRCCEAAGKGNAMTPRLKNVLDHECWSPVEVQVATNLTLLHRDPRATPPVHEL